MVESAQGYSVMMQKVADLKADLGKLATGKRSLSTQLLPTVNRYLFRIWERHDRDKRGICPAIYVLCSKYSGPTDHHFPTSCGQKAMGNLYFYLLKGRHLCFCFIFASFCSAFKEKNSFLWEFP